MNWGGSELRRFDPKKKKKKKILEFCLTTMRIPLALLNRTLESSPDGKFYVVYFYHNKKRPN